MGIIKIRATKPTPDSKIGIKYSSDGMKMTITGIFDDSIFASTDLKVGHEVMRVNEASVYGKPMEWIKATLASIEDEVELDVRVNDDTKNYIQIRATKPTSDSKIGIKYLSDGMKMTITGIFDDSIFASTDLKVGHEVVRINEASVNGKPMEWIKTTLASIEGEVELDIKVSEDINNYIHIRATKPTPDSKLGIKYVVGDQSMVITGILPGSIFMSTQLKVGHEVFVINGTPVAGNDRNGISTMLSSISNTIVFDVKNPGTASVPAENTGGGAETANCCLLILECLAELAGGS